MNNAAIVARIKERLKETGQSAAAVSIEAGGSKDLIRNWLRGVEEGKRFKIQQDNLEAVANSLGVSYTWLVYGSDAGADARGMSEELASFSPKPHQVDAVRALFADTARHAQVMLRLALDLPGLGLATGDTVVTDLSREPAPGDLVAAHVNRDGAVRTVIRRFLPPYLLACDQTHDREPLRADDPSVTLRYPIIGLIRGL